MDRRHSLTIAATGALGLSVMASIAAGFQSTPTPDQLLFLAGAALLFIGGSMIQTRLSDLGEVLTLKKNTFAMDKNGTTWLGCVHDTVSRVHGSDRDRLSSPGTNP